MKLLNLSFRTLSKFRLYAVVNVFGLAISLACVIVIARYVHQETTVNQFIEEIDRTYLTTIEQENRPRRLGAAVNINRCEDFTSPLDAPSVEKSTDFIAFENEQIGVNSHRYSVNIFVVDSVFLQIVPYPVVAGSNKFKAPEDIIITSKLAKRLFGNGNPIGQKISYVAGDLLNVAGVLGEPKTKSSFNFDMLVNTHLRKSWMRVPFQLVLLHKGADADAINREYGKYQKLTELHNVLSRFQLTPLSDFYFDTSLQTFTSDTILFRGNRTNVAVLSVVATLILLVGLFNFINIYTVITLRRGREFGIKKIYGAKGWQIFAQIYLENFWLVAMAVFGAWFVLEISEKLIAQNLALSLSDNLTFDVLISFSLLFLLPLITTLYPYLRYNYSAPVTSLRSVNAGGVSLVSRSVFLFLQYVITFGLIVISIYFMKQLRYMLNANVGYDTENVITCKILHPDNFYDVRNSSEEQENRNRFETITETIEREMNASPLFTNWTYANPAYSLEPHLPLKIEGSDYRHVGMLYMSRKQMKMLGYQLLEGRLWDSTDIAVQYRCIINETAKKVFNITDIHTTYLQPEHRLWYAQGDMSVNPAYEIVGVIKDFNTGHLSSSTIPVVIMYQEEYMKEENLMAKIVPGREEEAINFLEKLNSKLYGDTEFSYTFMKDEIAALYTDDKRVSRIYMTFSLIAIFISCLGLFALSLFDLRRRYREIALRKINGAKPKDILRLLLKNYAYLMGTSFVVAVPVSYWIITRYMENFAHRTAISWWLFAVSAVVMTGVSLLTLLWQVKKAIKINPSKAMKSINYLLTALFAVTSVTLQAQTKSVELPPVTFANTRSVEIRKVVLSDTATVLDIEASYTPGYWIKIVTDSYLQADGKKYMIRSGEGIALDSLFWMPKSGEASFKLVFDPLPVNTQTFDFIESDCENCFKLYGINLMNSRLNLPPIPEEFLREHSPESNYRSGLEKGDAFVSGKLSGYTPALGDFSLIYLNPITGAEQKKLLPVQPDGSFCVSATVCGPAFALISGKMLYAPIRIAPGKESKILVNLPEIYRADSRLFKNHEPYGKKIYYAGYFANLNTDLANSNLSQALRQDYQNEIAEMTPAQYKDFITEKYREVLAHNNALGLSPLARKIADADAAFELFNQLEMADYALTQAYAKKHNLPREEAMKNLVPVARTDEFNDYYLEIPCTDPDLLLATNISHRVEWLGSCRGSMGDRFEVLRYLSENTEVSPEDREFFNAFIAASEKGEEFENAASVGDVYNKYQALSAEFMKTRMGEGYLAKIWNTDDAFLLNLVKSMKIGSSIRDFNPLTDEQKEGLNPFPSIIRQALLEQNEELLARIEENKKKTGFTVLNPPANINEQLFVDMLTPFKGKVILVDVWATWCAPCRMANAQMEPVKAQFSDKDVVFLYLAGENSPENTWKNMITDMKGHHYRVNQAQWDYLSNSLNVRGVPTYIVIDRSGNHTFHTSGFPGVDTMKKELLKALGK